MFPAIRDRVAVGVSAFRRQSEWRADGDPEAVLEWDGYLRLVVDRGIEAAAGLAVAVIDEEIDLSDRGGMEVRVVVIDDVVGAAGARIAHDGRAAAGFIRGAGRELVGDIVGALVPGMAT